MRLRGAKHKAESFSSKILHLKDENEKKEEKEKKEMKKMAKQMATSMITDNKSPIPSPQRRHTDTKLKPSSSHSSISLNTLSPPPPEDAKPPAKTTGHRRHHSLTVPTAVLAVMEPPKSSSKQSEELSTTSIPVKVEYKDKVAKITLDISKTVNCHSLMF